MKKFYVGVKGIIKHPEKGVLLLQDPKIIDVPGGRIDDNENFEQTLTREISEELPGSKLLSIGELLGVSRIPKDIDGDTSLVLIFYRVDVELPEPLQLSEEHDSYMWVKDINSMPEGMNPDLKEIVEKLLS